MSSTRLRLLLFFFLPLWRLLCETTTNYSSYQVDRKFISIAKENTQHELLPQ